MIYLLLLNTEKLKNILLPVIITDKPIRSITLPFGFILNRLNHKYSIYLHGNMRTAQKVKAFCNFASYRVTLGAGKPVSFYIWDFQLILQLVKTPLNWFLLWQLIT